MRPVERSEPGQVEPTRPGDTGTWRRLNTLSPEGAGSRIDFAQEVEVRGPVLRAASPLLHGVFARQHAAVMWSAEHGMRAAL